MTAGSSTDLICGQRAARSGKVADAWPPGIARPALGLVVNGLDIGQCSTASVEQDLLSYFQGKGCRVSWVQLACDSAGGSKGFAVVSFDDEGSQSRGLGLRLYDHELERELLMEPLPLDPGLAGPWAGAAASPAAAQCGAGRASSSAAAPGYGAGARGGAAAAAAAAAAPASSSGARGCPAAPPAAAAVSAGPLKGSWFDASEAVIAAAPTPALAPAPAPRPLPAPGSEWPGRRGASPPSAPRRQQGPWAPAGRPQGPAGVDLPRGPPRDEPEWRRRDRSPPRAGQPGEFRRPGDGGGLPERWARDQRSPPRAAVPPGDFQGQVRPPGAAEHADIGGWAPLGGAQPGDGGVWAQVPGVGGVAWWSGYYNWSRLPDWRPRDRSPPLAAARADFRRPGPADGAPPDWRPRDRSPPRPAPQAELRRSGPADGGPLDLRPRDRSPPRAAPRVDFRLPGPVDGGLPEWRRRDRSPPRRDRSPPRRDRSPLGLQGREEPRRRSLSRQRHEPRDADPDAERWFAVRFGADPDAERWSAARFRRASCPPELRRASSPSRGRPDAGVDQDAERWLDARFGRTSCLEGRARRRPRLGPEALGFLRQILCSGGTAGGSAAAAAEIACAAADPPARRGVQEGSTAAAAAATQAPPGRPWVPRRRLWVRDAICQTVPVWEERDACVICLQMPRTHALSPCGHQCVCAACSGRQRNAKCPLCRIATDGVFEVFSGFDLGLPRTPTAAAAAASRSTRFRLRNRRCSPGSRPKLDLHNVAECLQEVALANTAKEVEGGMCAVNDAGCQTIGHDMCVICGCSQATHAAVPCGHLCLCERCAEDSALSPGPCRDGGPTLKCPVCLRSGGVQRYLKIFS